MSYKRRNITFIIVVFCSLIGLTIMNVIKETKFISHEENRYLTTFESLKETSYFDNSFQKKFEDAMMDQFVGRNTLVKMKKNFDYLTNRYMLSLTSDLTLNKVPGVDVNQIGNSDWLINMIVEDNEENRYRFKTFAEQINRLQDRHSNTEVYVYMPTQVHDTAVFDDSNGIVGGGPALTKVFKDTLKVPYAEYKIDSIDDYKKAYFKSDHHPNHVGVNEFYKDIHKLLELDDNYLKPIGEDCHISEKFYGTFAKRTGFITEGDDFCVYQYDLPEFEVYANGEPQYGYMKRNDFSNVKEEDFAEDYPYYYGIAYSGYEPYMEIYTHQEDKENILVIGDSYSTAVVDLIASHFNHTYRVLPYKVDGGFNYDEYIEQNDIDKVLFMFTFENYYYQDEWGDRWQSNLIEEVNK